MYQLFFIASAASLVAADGFPEHPNPLPMAYNMFAYSSGSDAIAPFLGYAVDTGVPFLQALRYPGGNATYDACDFHNSVHFTRVNETSCTRSMSTCDLSLGNRFNQFQLATYFAPCDPDVPPPPNSLEPTESVYAWYRYYNSGYYHYYCLSNIKQDDTVYSALKVFVYSSSFETPIFRLDVQKFEAFPSPTAFNIPAVCDSDSTIE